MRPHIDGDDDLQDRVESYAKNQGLRRSRAWAELVRAGLEAENGGEN